MDDRMLHQRGWRELATSGDKINQFTGIMGELIWSPRSCDSNDQADDWVFAEGSHSDFAFTYDGKPVMTGYLLAGSRIGPGALGVVSKIVQVETFAQFGVIFVFFALDLEYSTTNLKVVRAMTILGGLLQIFLLMCLFGITALLCGGKSSEEIIVGTYLSMSLTAMVLKFLMEMNSIKTLHGQVTIGTLMLQDCAIGLLFALFLVLGGTSCVLQGVILFTKSLLILITFLAILSILSSTWLPLFFKLMISLSSQTNELYKHGLVQHVTQFLSSNSLTNLSRLTSDGFIGLLVKISSGSIVAFGTSHEFYISSPLREILSTSDLSHGVSTSQFVRGLSNQLICPVISGIQLSLDSSQRSTSREVLKCLFGAFPAGKSPTITKYTVDPHDPLSLQDLLLQRDLVLTQLKSNLLKAQHHIKKIYADKKRSQLVFNIGDLVLVKLKPYHQHSVALRKNQKWGLRYFGPFPVVQKTGLVAYKLLLPPSAKIHPVFHLSLIKPCKGEPQQQNVPLPLLSDAFGPIVQPAKVLQTRVVLRGAEQIPQPLIQWEGTDRHKATWEVLSYIVEYPNFNLEDKVDFYGGGNVTNNGQAEAREELMELVIPVGHVYGDEAINEARKSERKRATSIAFKNYVWGIK